MQTTKLSTIINRMDRWQDLVIIEEQFKVRDLDAAIREIKRSVRLPWTLKKSSLKVFADVYEYPIEEDHEELAFLENINIDEYSDSLRFWNTSIKQFYQQMKDNRNLLTELWIDGEKMLGVNYREDDLSTKTLSTAEDKDDYTYSDDVISIEKDSVIYKKGNGSIKVSITNNTGVATIKNTFDSFRDSDYKKKYHFRWIYLANVPTSIEMRLQTDDNNYLTATITKQFAGQAFKAGQWNLIAYNLDEATEVGAFDSDNITSEKIILNGAETGTYYLDESSLKEWKLLDYWYYSKYLVKTVDSDVPNQEYFYNSNDVYSTDSELVGDTAWADVVMYDAMLYSINEKENTNVFNLIAAKRRKAWEDLIKKYPSLSQVIITQRYRFNNEPKV